MKKICLFISVCVLYFFTTGLYAQDTTKDDTDILVDDTKTEAKDDTKTEVNLDDTKQPLKEVDPTSDKIQEENVTATEKQIEELEKKEVNSQVEEETEEVEEPIIYKKEGDLGLSFKFAWGATRLSTSMEYIGKKVETKTVDTSYKSSRSTSYTVDSDTYLGLANFMFTVTYRPMDLPLDVGLSFMMERFKESYPLFARGEAGEDKSTYISSATDESYNVKTKMQKISLDIMYSFPEFVVTPYIALNIYPWYRTRVEGFQYKGQDWIENKGKISADSDIGYGCTIGVGYNIIERFSVFLQLSFEKNVSKIKISDYSTDALPEENDTLVTNQSARFELEHKILKIMLGAGYSI